MVTAQPIAPPTERVAASRLWWASPLAGAAAAAVNALVYMIAFAAGAIPLTVLIPSIDQPISVIQVVISSFIPAIIAGVLLALLGRFARRPVRTFRIIAAVILVLSFGYPFTIPGAPLAMILTLNLMHVIAAAIIVGILTTVPIQPVQDRR